MTPLFKKLNFKGQTKIVAVNYPDSFQPELNEMSKETEIITKAEHTDLIEFAIAFAVRQEEVDRAAHAIAPKLKEDAVVWFCYPKGSSKKYKCEFNRDNGWRVMGEYELEPVRQVAIDEDWSAVRFRHVRHIKNITRRKSMALTEEAKKRSKNKS